MFFFLCVIVFAEARFLSLSRFWGFLPEKAQGECGVVL